MICCQFGNMYADFSDFLPEEAFLKVQTCAKKSRESSARRFTCNVHHISSKIICKVTSAGVVISA